jgi:hypothetical protein
VAHASSPVLFQHAKVRRAIRIECPTQKIIKQLSEVRGSIGRFKRVISTLKNNVSKWAIGLFANRLKNE